MKKEPSPSEKIAIDHAAELLHEVDFLIALPEFQSFLTRFRGRLDQMAESILHTDELSPVDREALRRERKGMLEVMQAPSTFRQGALNVLRAHGIN